jgi:hypothetical protein
VLGHEGCGAVTAALAYRFDDHHEAERIEALLDMIVPGLDDLDRIASAEETPSRGGRGERPADDPPAVRIAGRRGAAGPGCQAGRRRL